MEARFTNSSLAFLGSKRSRRKIDDVIDLFNSTYQRLETESVRHAMVCKLLIHKHGADCTVKILERQV